MATVLLVRHGETPWNRERRIQGWAPTPLTEAGVEQARRCGATLAEAYAVDRLVASDLRRVMETVRYLRQGGALEVPVTVDPRWRERDFGVYQGLGYRAFFEGYPAFSLEASGVSAATEVPRGGESLAAMYDRVLAGWDDLRNDIEPGETVAVVSHGGPIRAVVGAVKGIDVIEAMLESEQDNCCINEIEVDVTDGSTRLRRENGTACATRR